MTLNDEMLATFGRENLVYANPERICYINFPDDETKQFILRTGFPRVVSYFRFSMDFEPIAQDIKIGEFTKEFGQVFIIGCKSGSLFVGRTIQLSEIGLNDNASLSDIGRRIEFLGIDDDIMFDAEVTLSSRICLNLENDGQIISIEPIDFAIDLVNSNIHKLATSLITCGKILSSDFKIETKINKLEEHLRKIDPHVWKSEKNLWAKIIDGMRRDAEGY